VKKSADVIRIKALFLEDQIPVKNKNRKTVLTKMEWNCPYSIRIGSTNTVKINNNRRIPKLASVNQ
jgi:hypothetical protein